MNTLRRLKAYCKTHEGCVGCKLATERLYGTECAFDLLPVGWELDKFEEAIKEIVGKEIEL